MVLVLAIANLPRSSFIVDLVIVLSLLYV